MTNRKTNQVPVSLKVVAWLFIIMGVFSLVDVFGSLYFSKISINFGVLGLFIGPGLFALQPGWRSCAITLLLIPLILVPIVGFFMLGHYGPLEFMIFGQKTGYASRGFTYTIITLLYSLTFWQYRILMKPDIRRLFASEDG